jgi:hypothetical protein
MPTDYPTSPNPSESLWNRGLGADDCALLTPARVRTATVYRTQAKALKPDVEQHNYAEAGEPQFQLAVFGDGKTAQRWLTASRSMVWWDSLDDLYSVHIYAHPDYGTKVVWDDGEVEEL